MPRRFHRLRKAARRAGQAITSAVTRWPELVDQAIYTVAPSVGARRMATRQQWRMARRREEILNVSLGGTERDRLYGSKWMQSRLSPDAALEQDLETQRERCEELYTTDTIAHGAVEGRVAHEVGTGILPQSRITAHEDTGINEDTAKAINERLEDVARRWSEVGCDRTGQHSLVQIEKLVVRNFAVYGEAFVALADRGGSDKPIPLTLDVIHPMRVETPPEASGDENVRLGIQYDGDGQVIGYYVRRSHPHDTKAKDIKYDYIPRYDSDGQLRMLHVFDPIFPGQTRGMSWLGPAINKIRDASDISLFTIVSMQVEACFAAFVKPGTSGMTPREQAAAAAGSTDSQGRRLEEIRPGAIEYLNYGEEVVFGSPVKPGGTFFPMMEFTLRSISAALNYPYELLANNFFRTTFSSGRLSMMAGRLGFNMRRQVLVEKLLIPIWKRIVFESVMVGELDGLVDLADYAAHRHRYERHVWQARSGIIHINPEQEVKAHALELENDMTTLADIYGEGGLDWEDRLKQRYTERVALARQDVELEALRANLREQHGLPAADATADSTDEKVTAEAAENAEAM